MKTQLILLAALLGMAPHLTADQNPTDQIRLTIRPELSLFSLEFRKPYEFDYKFFGFNENGEKVLETPYVGFDPKWTYSQEFRVPRGAGLNLHIQMVEVDPVFYDFLDDVAIHLPSHQKEAKAQTFALRTRRIRNARDLDQCRFNSGTADARQNVYGGYVGKCILPVEQSTITLERL